MKSKQVLNSLYYSMKRRKKINEQLQIGKIKFEVTPIYINKICVHSMFQLKYTQQVEVKTTNYKYSYIIKTVIFILTSFAVYTLSYNTLLNLGILSESNYTFIAAATPYIFEGVPAYYTPHLTTLLQQINILNP